MLFSCVQLASKKELTYGIEKNGKSVEKLGGFILTGDASVTFDAVQCLFSVKFNGEPKVVNGEKKDIVFKNGDKEVNVSQKIATMLKDSDSITFASH